MEDIKLEDVMEEVLTPETTEEATEVAPEQDLVKIELEKVQNGGRTEKEKAEFTLKKNAERVKALGGDPSSILGIEPENLDEDDQPVTLGMLKKLQQETASKTALQLAEEIPNETERELAKWHLQNTIRSTGNPAKDLELANSLVNSVKNKQVLEEIARKNPAKTHSSASSAPATHEVDQNLTEEEVKLMKWGGLTKEDVIKTRQK